MPTASVAMATYNGARFITAQLDSILAQSELPDEIVITDDGSTDDTLSIIAAFAERSPVPIRFHANAERLGFARNFMKAIELCRSELIFLCDQDDIWAEHKVERMKAAFDDPQVYLAYHGALVVTADNAPLYELYRGDEERALLSVEPIHPWYSSYGLTQAFRAELRRYDDLWSTSLNHVHRQDEPLSHDQWYFFLAQMFGRVEFVDASLVRYRQHGTNSVGAAQVVSGAGLWQRLRAKFRLDPRQDRLKAAAADRRAEILVAMAHTADGACSERCATTAQRYASLAERHRRRYSAYTAGSKARRAGCLLRMIASRDYAHHPWGMRKSSLARDLVVGTLGIRVD
jgi:glycosyltransferase involved in cell wall biosynthesis